MRILELLVVALAGAGIALGAAAAFGKLGDHTTVQQVTSPTQTMAHSTAPAPAAGLTPEKIYGQDAPGVVQITATTLTQGQTDPYGFPVAPTTEQSLGSGFVIDKAGHIVTNFHVVQGAERVQVSFSGQDQLNARVVGKDPSTDVAVLKIDAHARALTPLPLGDSDSATVGDAVYAIGNPFGFTRTLTTGVVSAVQRQLQGRTSLPIEHAIQTDAAINHGNSGGPLIDADGRVIGITSQISTGNTGGRATSGSASQSRSTPSAMSSPRSSRRARSSTRSSVSRQLRSRAQLAEDLQSPRQGRAARRDRDEEQRRGEGRARGRTTTVVVGGERVPARRRHHRRRSTTRRSRRTSSFAMPIAQKQPGDKMKLEIYRNGSKKTVTATLGQRGSLTPDSALPLGPKRRPAAARLPARAAAGLLLPLPATLFLDGARADRPRAHGGGRSEDELWQEDGGGTTTGGSVSARTRSLPASGCAFVAEFMTAAHLILVWQELDDINLLRHAARARDVGRNPRVTGYRSEFGPSASYYAWVAAGRPVHGVKATHVIEQRFGEGRRSRSGSRRS